MTQYTPMIQQYLKVKADYQDVFIFRLGDFMKCSLRMLLKQPMNLKLH